MIGYILLFFAGRAFYLLAKEHDRKGWVYGLYSVLVFFGTQLILGILVFGIWASVDLDALVRWAQSAVYQPGRLIDLVGSIVGFIAMRVFYMQLKKRFLNPKHSQVFDPEVLDQPEHGD